MTDGTTGLPPAGWYADPATQGQERWWGGSEWTSHTRPIEVVVAPAPPQFASQTQQYASETPAWMAPAAALTPTTAASWQGGGSVEPYAFAGTTSSGRTANTAYYSAPPTNPLAMWGFLLSFIGAYLLGLIFSILALKKARGFEYEGQPPVGRVLARWGLGIGIAGMVICIAALAIIGPAYITAIQSGVLSGAGSPIVTESPLPEDDFVGDEEFVDPTGGRDPNPARAMEDGIVDLAPQAFGVEASSVTCPETISEEPGSVVHCTLVLEDGREITVTTTYSEGGSLTQFEE